MGNQEYELYHHGVKGMKWGVRKKDKYVSRIKAYRNANKAAKEARDEAIKRGVSSTTMIQKRAALAKAKSKLNDIEYNLDLKERRQASRKASGEALKEKIKSTAKKKVSELNQQLSEKRKQELYDIMFPGRNHKQPWDEKPHNERRPWDENPHRKRGGKI